MSVDFIILIIIVVILFFVYSHQRTQFATAASAIRQVFSGGCRLHCRQSGISGISGLSALQGPNQTVYQAGTSHDCVCDTCPCELIENFLRTCSPATQLFTLLTDGVSDLYNNILDTFIELSNHIARVIECSTSCRRQAQIVRTNCYDSTENFSFCGKEDTDDTKKNDHISKTATSKASHMSVTCSRGSSTSITDRIGIGLSNVNASEAKASTSSSSCPKCVEKGKTCLRECPNAKK